MPKLKSSILECLLLNYLLLVSVLAAPNLANMRTVHLHRRGERNYQGLLEREFFQMLNKIDPRIGRGDSTTGVIDTSIISHIVDAKPIAFDNSGVGIKEGDSYAGIPSSADATIEASSYDELGKPGGAQNVLGFKLAIAHISEILNDPETANSIMSDTEKRETLKNALQLWKKIINVRVNDILLSKQKKDFADWTGSPAAIYTGGPNVPDNHLNVVQVHANAINRVLDNPSYSELFDDEKDIAKLRMNIDHSTLSTLHSPRINGSPSLVAKIDEFDVWRNELQGFSEAKKLYTSVVRTVDVGAPEPAPPYDKSLLEDDDLSSIFTDDEGISLGEFLKEVYEDVIKDDKPTEKSKKSVSARTITKTIKITSDNLKSIEGNNKKKLEHLHYLMIKIKNSLKSTSNALRAEAQAELAKLPPGSNLPPDHALYAKQRAFKDSVDKFLHVRSDMAGRGEVTETTSVNEVIRRELFVPNTPTTPKSNVMKFTINRSDLPDLGIVVNPVDVGASGAAEEIQNDPSDLSTLKKYKDVTTVTYENDLEELKNNELVKNKLNGNCNNNRRSLTQRRSPFVRRGPVCSRANAKAISQKTLAMLDSARSLSTSIFPNGFYSNSPPPGGKWVGEDLVDGSGESIESFDDMWVKLGEALTDAASKPDFKGWDKLQGVMNDWEDIIDSTPLTSANIGEHTSMVSGYNNVAELMEDTGNEAFTTKKRPVTKKLLQKPPATTTQSVNPEKDILEFVKAAKLGTDNDKIMPLGDLSSITASTNPAAIYEGATSIEGALKSIALDMDAALFFGGFNLDENRKRAIIAWRNLVQNRAIIQLSKESRDRKIEDVAQMEESLADFNSAMESGEEPVIRMPTDLRPLNHIHSVLTMDIYEQVKAITGNAKILPKDVRAADKTTGDIVAADLFTGASTPDAADTAIMDTLMVYLTNNKAKLTLKQKIQLRRILSNLKKRDEVVGKDLQNSMNAKDSLSSDDITSYEKGRNTYDRIQTLKIDLSEADGYTLIDDTYAEDLGGLENGFPTYNRPRSLKLKKLIPARSYSNVKSGSKSPKTKLNVKGYSGLQNNSVKGGLKSSVGTTKRNSQ